jgi:hypothetical protein
MEFGKYLALVSFGLALLAEKIAPWIKIKDETK